MPLCCKVSFSGRWRARRRLVVHCRDGGGGGGGNSSGSSGRRFSSVCLLSWSLEKCAVPFYTLGPFSENVARAPEFSFKLSAIPKLDRCTLVCSASNFVKNQAASRPFSLRKPGRWLALLLAVCFDSCPGLPRRSICAFSSRFLRRLQRTVQVAGNALWTRRRAREPSFRTETLPMPLGSC